MESTRGTAEPLTTEEAREVLNIARRIASILLLEPSLDANYSNNQIRNLFLAIELEGGLRSNRAIAAAALFQNAPITECSIIG